MLSRLASTQNFLRTLVVRVRGGRGSNGSELTAWATPLRDSSQKFSNGGFPFISSSARALSPIREEQGMMRDAAAAISRGQNTLLTVASCSFTLSPVIWSLNQRVRFGQGNANDSQMGADDNTSSSSEAISHNIRQFLPIAIKSP